MKSILKDEDDMDKGVADKSNKRKPDDDDDDDDRDEGPPAGSNRGLKRSYVELEYNMEECYKALNDQLDWNNPEGDKYPFDLSKPLPLNRLFNLKGEDIVHLAATSRMFTRRIVIQKRVEDLQLGVKSYPERLNISRPLAHKAGISGLEPYTAYSKP
nr:hypothetical protein [Tanacetum cinerariifolium]